MNLKNLAAKPQLVKIVLDDADTIAEFNEPLEFYVYDRQPIGTFVRLAGMTSNDFAEIVKVVNDLILDEEGNPTGEIVGSDDVAEEAPTEPVKLNAQAKWPFSTNVESDYAQFKCLACDYSTDDINDLVENTHDDDRGAYICPECESKVDLG